MGDDQDLSHLWNYERIYNRNGNKKACESVMISKYVPSTDTLLFVIVTIQYRRWKTGDLPLTE